MKIFSSKYTPEEVAEKRPPVERKANSGDAAAGKKPDSAKTTVKPKAQTARPTAKSTIQPSRPASVSRPTAQKPKPAATPAKPAAKPAAKPTQTAKPAAKPKPAAHTAKLQVPAELSRTEKLRAQNSTSTKAVRTAVSKSAAAAQTVRTERTMAESAALRREEQRKKQAAAKETMTEEAQPRVRAGFVETNYDPEPMQDPVKKKKKRRKKKKKKAKKTVGGRLLRLVVALLVIVALYFTAVFSSIPFIAKWRTIYIQTAMATMRHQWLATYFIPHSVIDKVMMDLEESRQSQVGVNTLWDNPVMDGDSDQTRNPTLTDTKGMSKAEIAFFNTFWEVDVNSMLEYVRSHPDAVADGWDKIDINEAALTSNGTTIHTVQGEQVLAIDAQEGVLIVRESGTGYRGVMAICKDPSRLSLKPASTIGSVGQVVGEIGSANNGVIAMNGSGFEDAGGVGNGGTLVGWAMCSGQTYGQHMLPGYKRLELHEDNLVYIRDAGEDVAWDCTDAVEFSPAMIIDGNIVVDDRSGFSDLQPRSCIGQSQYGEIIMLLVEGRLPTVSLGISVPDCAELMAEHKCAQAMNLDGGTSAMIWYKGDYIMKSSNPVLQAGRTLPNAFIYESIN